MVLLKKKYVKFLEVVLQYLHVSIHMERQVGKINKKIFEYYLIGKIQCIWNIRKRQEMHISTRKYPFKVWNENFSSSVNTLEQYQH